MQKQVLRLMNWVHDQEEGQGLVEYGLIIALVAIVVIGALTVLGSNVNDKFNSVATSLGS